MTGRAHRLLVEWQREASRRATLLLLAAYWAAAAVAALIAIGADGVPKTYFVAAYLLFPLFMLPFAARLATRDRESGAAPVLATTPLTPGEALAAKVVFLASFVLAALAGTLPLAAAVVSDAAVHAFRDVIAYFPWAMVLAAAAAAAGLVIGYALPGRATPALSVAFTVGIAWVALAFQASAIVSLGKTPAQVAFLVLLVHASPVMWALDAKAPDAAAMVLDPVGLLVTTGVFVVATLIVLRVVALRLQEVDGWRPRARAPRAALAALVAIAIVAGGAIAVAGPPPPAEDQGVRYEPDARVGELLVHADLRSADGAFVVQDWAEAGVVLALRVTGRAERTVSVTDASLSSPSLAFTRTSSLPQDAHLDAAAGRDGNGIGEVEAHFTVRPHRLQKNHVVDVHAVIDGHDVHVTAALILSTWPIPLAPTLVAGATPAVAFLAVGTVLPGRLNRW